MRVIIYFNNDLRFTDTLLAENRRHLVFEAMGKVPRDAIIKLKPTR